MHTSFSNVIIAFFLAIVAATNQPASADTSPSQDQMQIAKSALASLRACLSTVTSYQFEGQAVVSQSDEMMSIIDPSKRKSMQTRYFKFHLWSKGDAIKAEEDYSDADGHPQETTTQYEDSKRCVFQYQNDAAGIHQRSSSPAGSDAIYLMCPAFMDYTFLNIEVNKFGPTALSSADLSGSNLWNRTYQSLKSCSMESNGHIAIKLTGSAGYSMVDLVPLTNRASLYRPSTIKFYDNGSQLLYQIDLLNYSGNTLGDIATKIQMTTYGNLSGKYVRLATWDFTIGKFQLNHQIDDTDLNFDPAAVDRIWDADHNVTITVPH